MIWGLRCKGCDNPRIYTYSTEWLARHALLHPRQLNTFHGKECEWELVRAVWEPVI